ncbi:hypothetical protein Hanom_Chr11g01015771 [Helianthus anomalus]
MSLCSIAVVTTVSGNRRHLFLSLFPSLFLHCFHAVRRRTTTGQWWWWWWWWCSDCESKKKRGGGCCVVAQSHHRRRRLRRICPSPAVHLHQRGEGRFCVSGRLSASAAGPLFVSSEVKREVKGVEPRDVGFCLVCVYILESYVCAFVVGIEREEMKCFIFYVRVYCMCFNLCVCFTSCRQKGEEGIRSFIEILRFEKI